MIRVLVLDADAAAATVVTNTLQDKGHEVRSATRTADAWSALEQAPPDVLILDIDLGAENGAEFLERLREDPVLGDLAVIVHSSVSHRDVIHRCLETGVQGFLIKPDAIGRLAGEIERVMRDPWRRRQFETAEEIKARTGRSLTNLAPLYLAVAGEIAVALDDLETLQTNIASAAGLGRLDELKTCALAIGCLPLRRLVEQTHRAATEVNISRIRFLVGRFLCVARLLAIQAGADPATIKRPQPAATPTELIGARVTTPPPAAPAAVTA
jgi:CheY-like chemotaxis protein